jgi:dipeptidyl aminopeptidase/acylaminoacyl peptidase
VTKEFITIPNSVGDQLNAWIIKPKNFDPNKKYPLFMFQYSGPVRSGFNSWDGGNGIWFEMLAQKGYVVACVDGTWNSYKGAKFKKVTNNWENTKSKTRLLLQNGSGISLILTNPELESSDGVLVVI